MNLRDEVLDAFAEGRGVAEELGLRRFHTYVRRRTWRSGSSLPWSTSAPGRGYPCDAEVLLTPAPKVEDVSVRMIASSGGTFQAGDIRLSKITPRREPSTGLELWELTEAPASPAAEERHVVLVGRSGTPWHVYEGTARLLTPGPYDAASAVACANALQEAMAGHLPNTEAHLVADPMVPGPAATDLASAITLANALRTAWVAHRSSLVVHPAADPYPLTAPAASDGQTLAVLLHDLLRAFNAHVAEGPVRECTVVHASAARAFSHELIVRPTRRTP